MSGLLIAAAAAVIGAVALAYFALQERKKYQAFLLTETSTTAMVKATHAAATEAAGQNSFAEIVELEGTAEAGPDGPLTAELSGTACVWYRQKVTRRERRETRDKDGNRSTETRNEVVSDNTSRSAFVLRDGEGEITLLPEDIDQAEKVLDDFQPESRSKVGTNIQIGALSMNLGSRGNETIGYKREEWVLRPGTRVYVRGEAADRGGALEVRTPKDKSEKLVISTRSEDEILAGHKRTFSLYAFGGAACGVLAIVLLVLAIVR